MMNIPDERKLSGLRKYLQEAVIAALACAVVYLFLQMRNTDSFIRDELMKNNIRMEVIIDKNTRVMELIMRKEKIRNNEGDTFNNPN